MSVLTDLTPEQAQQRSNIRNLYYPATREDLERGARIFASQGNYFAVACVLEIAVEAAE